MKLLRANKLTHFLILLKRENVPAHDIMCFYIPYLHWVGVTAHKLYHLLPPKDIRRYNFSTANAFLCFQNFALVVTRTHLFHSCPVSRTFTRYNYFILHEVVILVKCRARALWLFPHTVSLHANYIPAGVIFSEFLKVLICVSP